MRKMRKSAATEEAKGRTMDWAPVSQRNWDMKYRFRDASGAADADLDATWWRVARALAAPERDPELWAGRFHQALQGFKVLPAGRAVGGGRPGPPLPRLHW